MKRSCERDCCVAVADLNDDGKADLVATHDDDPLVAVLLGDGKGGFNPAPVSPLRPPNPVWGVTVADLNGDGKLDLATVKLTWGQKLAIDPVKETFINNPEADALLTREYRPPFVVPAAGQV